MDKIQRKKSKKENNVSIRVHSSQEDGTLRIKCINIYASLFKIVNLKSIYVPNVFTSLNNYCEQKESIFNNKNKINTVFVGNLTFEQNVKAVMYIKHALDILRIKYPQYYEKVFMHIIGGPLGNIPRYIIESDHVSKGHLILHGVLSEGKSERYIIYHR